MSVSSVFQPSPQSLRELVLDYLLHNSYIDTARAFAADSAGIVNSERILEGLAGDATVETDETHDGMDGIEDGAIEDMKPVEISEEVLSLVEMRREIKFHILSGRVDEATQLLNTHFPSVLQEHDEDAPPSSRVLGPDAFSPFARVHYTSQLSTKPIHIALNLRILAFIEAARTIPLPYASDPQRGSNAASSVGSSAGAERSSDAYSAQQTELLHRAQRLYASVESLRDVRDRDLYRKELNSVGGLLAYRVPESSKISKYMEQGRREAVADQVNSAILYHMGQPATSLAELYVRQTAAVWLTMRDVDLRIPPPSLWPAGISLPLSDALGVEDPVAPPSKAGSSVKAEKVEAEQYVPQFDLRQFLDSP
ncbi:hypothetical protein M0805_000633 [Coniferiporia weirii]|nr:hypothetical protein M0805_000633 [Coniferiporia weirii]